MPKKNYILNLPGFTIKKVSGENPVLIEASYKGVVRCIHCNNKKLRKKASFIRRIRHESIGLRRSYLLINGYKYYCSLCNRYFNQRFPGIRPYQRASEPLHRQVFHQHSQGVSQKDLARDLHCGKSTIERWYHEGYTLRHKKIAHRSCPRVLGIDEHFFNKKQGYATTFCDLAKHKVFEIVKGRSEKELNAFLNTLEGKDKVRVVCIDLSPSYRALIKRHFPNAKIVADRFHVIRLLNQCALQAYQQLDKDSKYQRGLLAALRANPANLTLKQMNKRDDYLLKHPIIAAIYYFKQRLHRLLMKKHRTAKQCERLIPLFLKRLQQLKDSPLEPLKTLAKTLHLWREEVVRMWRFTKNNGITEGFHRKMKLIQRRAYGFKNFENYRIRVKVLCG